MDTRYFEFAQHHWVLVALFLVLLAAFFLNEARRTGKRLSPAEVVRQLNSDQAVVLDVRDRPDYAAGHIKGSIHIPLSALKERIDELKKQEGKQIVVVCKTGQTAGAAIKILGGEGVSNVVRLRGGIEEWKSASLPLSRKK